jgi:hypothetical protein
MHDYALWQSGAQSTTSNAIVQQTLGVCGWGLIAAAALLNWWAAAALEQVIAKVHTIDDARERSRLAL